MQPNDVACDCKSQAAAVRARRNERLEDLVADGAGDADAVIQHLNRCFGRIWRQDANECARQSWCDPAGASPAQVRSSVRLVASVAWPLATVVAKRTQRLHGVWD